MKVLHIVGARPNFMKAAPVMRAMGQAGGFEQTLVHTGQHYQPNMSDVFLRELNLPWPDVNLQVGPASQSRQTAQIMLRFEPVVTADRPDWVLVYGDVNSTLACALVCAKTGIPVAHVEAGLRSRDRTMPEELNRILVDQLSDVLFTPSRDADQNLAQEGISPERVHFVGNVMIDTLRRLLPQAEQRWKSLREGLELQDHILVTLHRPSNVDDPLRLKELFSALDRVARKCQVLVPLHPRTRLRLERSQVLDALKDLRIVPPVGYIDCLALQSRAALIVTDSGGMQEETTYLEVPCLTVRPNTERPVTISQGTNRLFNGDPGVLDEAIFNRLEESRAACQVPELWDGAAGPRIASILASRC